MSETFIISLIQVFTKGEEGKGTWKRGKLFTLAFFFYYMQLFKNIHCIQQILHI